jgi:hypothetical protein
MTRFVTIVGNGESRRGFDLIPVKQFSTVIGCNAQFRDYVFDYFVCCDKHMCQEAANSVGKNTTIYTRSNWVSQFAMWPNVKTLPALPYEGEERPDDPWHWGTGPHAGNVALSFKPKAVFMIGFDLYSVDGKNVNNIYKDTIGYTYIKRPVDPRYWIYQFAKLFEYSKCRWIIVNHEGWKMPDEWKKYNNVFAETYEGMASYINKQLDQQKSSTK